MLEKKRKAWMTWVPTGILVAVILAIAVSTVTLLSGGLGQPAGAPTPGQVTDKNWSIFTEAGLAYIARTREVRLDLHSTPVDAGELGLEDDGILRVGPNETNLDYYLTFYGGGDPPGGAKLTVTELSIRTEGGALAGVTAVLRDVDYFRATLDSLLSQAELYGWDTSVEEDIFAQAEQATRDGEPFEFSLGTGAKLGVPVTATATCSPGGYCLLQYELAPSVG